MPVLLKGVPHTSVLRVGVFSSLCVRQPVGALARRSPPRRTEEGHKPTRAGECYTRTPATEAHTCTRTAMRRYTRLSNGFSRNLENHAAAVALNCFAYNFVKIHETLRTSPAMAAGVETRLWEVGDLVTLWESCEAEAKRAA
jgi:hypothetical protein